MDEEREGRSTRGDNGSGKEMREDEEVLYVGERVGSEGEIRG